MAKQSKPNKIIIRNRHVVISVLIMVIAAVFIVMQFHMLFMSAKQNLLNIWKNNTAQMARTTEYYLARPMDVVEFTASEIGNMMDRGQTNEDIGAFLITEMETYASLVEDNYTGVYGFVRGEYLDASGWVPEADYEPTQRPWYLAAKQAGGELAYVTPYLNLQTFTMMMSVSKLLDDGESVVSMDIFTDGLQRMVEELAGNDSVAAALIMDKDGYVVVHSEQDEVGKNYLSDEDPFKLELAEGVLSRRDDRLPEQAMARGEIVYTEPIKGNWHAVLILDESKLLTAIQYVKIVFALVLMLAILIWYVIFVSIDRKYKEAEQLNREVSAVADIYEAMNLIDLRTNRMTLLRSNDWFDGLLGGDLSDFSGRLPRLVEAMASAPFRDMLAQFMDPSTYDARMRNARSISHDFVDSRARWTRVQLIVVDRDDDGRLWHIIWATESIDEEHRQQENLRRLAETDALSKVRNRRSGEACVRAQLDAGAKGLFIVLDVDNFKSINDEYGHDIGDLVIVKVADSLRDIFRDSDIVFRLGGDEFAVFVPNVEEARTGDLILKRLNEKLKDISVPGLNGRRVTVSVGGAYYPTGDDDSFESLYQRADQRMYESKRQRRMNRADSPSDA